MFGNVYPPVLLRERNRMVNFDSSLGLKAAWWLLNHMPTLVTSADSKLLGDLVECYGYTVELMHLKSRAMDKVAESLTPDKIEGARKSVRKVLGSEAAAALDVHGVVFKWQAKLVESGASVMELPVSNYDGNLDAFRKGKSKYFASPCPLEKLLSLTKNKLTLTEATDLILEDHLLLFKYVLIPGFREPYCCAKGSSLRIETIQQACKMSVLFQLTDDLLYDFHTFMDEGIPDDSWMYLTELILSVQTEIGWEELQNKVGVSPHWELRFYFKDGRILSA